MKNKIDLKQFFITGTDVDIGKTIATRALLQSFNLQGFKTVGFKPISLLSDCYPEATSNSSVINEASSVSFDETLSPIVQSECTAYDLEIGHPDYQQLSEKLNVIREQADVILVEGSGGWRVKITPEYSFSQWVVSEQLPAIVVVGIQKGCLNHACLTVEALVKDGVEIVGWVANRVNPCMANYAGTIKALGQVLTAPLLGEIPYVIKPEQKDLSNYINISSLI